MGVSIWDGDKAERFVSALESVAAKVAGQGIIDDTAGLGDTDKTFSADKLTTDRSMLMSAINERYVKPQTGIPASDLASGVIPSVPVQDVQVNGTSVLSQGVANIPKAASGVYGVIKPNGMGVNVNSSGEVYIAPASSSEIKAGTYQYHAITPSIQEKAVFYGLAKASGDSSQSASSNAVGTYTSDAKIAIQNMLGVVGQSNIGNGLCISIDPETGYLISVTADVRDVQVNGTSILNNGVANLPIASSSNLGVVKTSAEFNGIGISDGYLYISKASDAKVLAGINQYNPIVPYNQHRSAFYGLAKAAGADMASSSNSVGNYTDSAKVAIQKMLGIYEPPFELLNEITLSEIGRIDVSADSNGTPYNLREVFIQILYPENAASIDSGYSRFDFYDGNSKRITMETSKYQTASYKKFKLLHIERHGNLTIGRYTLQSSVGGSGSWVTKPPNINGLSISDLSGNGCALDYGNVTRIAENSADTEPEGTIIRIYGQRAY